MLKEMTEIVLSKRRGLLEEHLFNWESLFVDVIKQDATLSY